jgi:DNA-binding Lrp family transcriptional regulator
MSIVDNWSSNYEQFFNSFALFSITMSEAYVLINCNLGTEDLVINELRSVSGVSEVKGVFGVYDVIARINADSEGDIKKVIAKIRSMSNIKSSLTMMVIEGQGG